MQNLQDIQDKIFFEAKSILDTLYKIDTIDDLLAKQDLFAEVTDRIAFLRILEKNEDNFSPILLDNRKSQFANDNEITDEASEHVEFNVNDYTDDIIEEEVTFTNELNDFEDEIETEEKSFSPPVVEERFEDFSAETLINSISESDLSAEDEIPFIVEQEEADYAERVAQKERDLEEMEGRRRTIVEFTKHETVVEDSVGIADDKSDTSQQHQAERKFKLSNIKGLKVVQQLFDNDPLEDDKIIEEPQSEVGSLLKSNVKTDFMQAERKKPEFRLDLNDKVAFSKSLFGGNDEELKATIERLNSFSNLEDAKNYLSEVYYLKDWSKVDEYAQRLWSLVENKFM